jgi:hypothetical protein
MRQMTYPSLLLASALSLAGPLDVGATNAIGCVRLNIRLNQTTVLHAKRVALTSPDGREHAAALRGDEFQVPKDLLSCPKLTVVIALQDESLHLVGIDQLDFRGTWDILLSDKAFSERFPLPKGAKAKEVCVVTFQWGEGDPRQIAQSGCRQPLTKWGQTEQSGDRRGTWGQTEAVQRRHTAGHVLSAPARLPLWGG